MNANPQTTIDFNEAMQLRNCPRCNSGTMVSDLRLEFSGRRVVCKNCGFNTAIEVIEDNLLPEAPPMVRNPTPLKECLITTRPGAPFPFREEQHGLYRLNLAGYAVVPRDEWTRTQDRLARMEAAESRWHQALEQFKEMKDGD